MAKIPLATIVNHTRVVLLNQRGFSESSPQEDLLVQMGPTLTATLGGKQRPKGNKQSCHPSTGDKDSDAG